MIIGAQKRVAALTSRNLRFLGMPIPLIPQLSETIVATTNIMLIQNALTTTITVMLKLVTQNPYIEKTVTFTAEVYSG